jgi:hypothetical protein
MHVRICPSASARAGDKPAKAFVSCWVMLAERYVPLKNIVVSRSSCVRGHYLLTVNSYFFVSTILNRYGNYPEIPTNTDRKIPRQYLFPICSTLSTTIK